MTTRDRNANPATPKTRSSSSPTLRPRRVQDPTTGLWVTLNPCGLIRLVGHLGRDRELHWTEERTWITTETVFDPILEDEVETEVEHHRPARPYLRLSLAVWEGGETHWHRLKVWDADEVGKLNARMARKGDRVEVTGRLETRRFTRDGREVVYTELVVESFRRLRPKIRLRQEPNPEEPFHLPKR